MHHFYFAKIDIRYRHELCPDWVAFEDDITERYTERISHLMKNYGDDFDFFDVANETTVNNRFDTPVSRWVKDIGPMNMLKFGTKLVRSFKPDAKLLYGDWNVYVEEYYDFLREMRENDIDIDILGIQSHMHVDRWSEEATMRIMDRAAEFARDFYTLVFSHPAVEALSWFDFTDHRWLGAPAGIVTDDLKIKPIYNTLYDLIHREWHTDADIATGSNGICKTRLFVGNYDITIDINGQKTTVNRDILRESFYAGGGEPERLVIEL